MMTRPKQFPTMVVTIILLAGHIAFAANDNIKADNSAINARDKSVYELTAQDQSTTRQATDTTRSIRIELTRDSDLSVYAKNVKIIVVNDLITLKGPVKSEAERMKILRTASRLAPNYKIDNQIEIVK